MEHKRFAARRPYGGRREKKSRPTPGRVTRLCGLEPVLGYEREKAYSGDSRTVKGFGVAGSSIIDERLFVLHSSFSIGDQPDPYSVNHFPQTGFVRLSSILAPKGPIPIGRSTWWAGVKSGRFPKPVKLGPRTTAWRVEDIRALIERGIE